MTLRDHEQASLGCLEPAGSRRNQRETASGRTGSVTFRESDALERCDWRRGVGHEESSRRDGG